MSTGEGFKSKLSLNSINQDKLNEKIQITIAKCKNLVSMVLINALNIYLYK
jgi:predicted metalloenzyme YecM